MANSGPMHVNLASAHEIRLLHVELSMNYMSKIRAFAQFSQLRHGCSVISEIYPITG
jgi:hypothetical protein